MTTAQLIAANLASARMELAETFPRLDDTLLDWAPAPGMRTVHGQLVEILSTEHQILDRIKGGPSNSYAATHDRFASIKTVDGLASALADLRAETLNHLAGLDEASLSASANVPSDWAEWLALKDVPVSELFRYIARHEAYHTGQLVSYLWANGDNPYEWSE